MTTPTHSRRTFLHPCHRRAGPPSRPADVRSSRRFLTALAAGLSLAFPAWGQTTAGNAPPAGSQASADQQTVRLSPFEVTASTVGPYQAAEALSGGRVRADLFEATNSISVVTSQLMQDVGARDTFNAAVYLAGISNNSSQVAGDRVSIRGFQVSNPDIDGFATPQSVVKLDPAFYERIEFVRGPDAILAPNGSPGGTLNLISKAARFDNFASLTGNLGRYDTDSADFDLNQMASSRVAYRIVGSGFDQAQGKNQGFHHSVGLMPSVLFKVGDKSQLLLHGTFFWGTAYNYLGFPINPASDASHFAGMLPGMDPYQHSYADNSSDPSSANHADRMIYRAMFTSQLTDNLSMRLSARYLWEWQTNNQWNLLGNSGGGYDPLTGQWTPGLVWSGSASAGFTSSPAPTPSSTYSLSQSPTNDLDHFIDVQHDYVYQFSNDAFSSETTAGVAAEMYYQQIKGYSATSPAINIFAIPATATWTVNPKPVLDQKVEGNFGQVYLNETLKFLDKHVIVNAGAAPTWYYEKVTNYLSGLAYATHPHPFFKNYGLTYLPLKDLALYYGHSESAAQIVNAPTASNPNPPQLQSGKQDEAGLRFRFLNGRAVASAGYYELHQTNNQIVNPALFSVPPPTTFQAPVLADRIARGWEYELNMAVTKEFSVIANFTNYRDRSPFGVPFRAESETSGAAFAQYRFLSGDLQGLAFGVGYTWQGKRPGDSAPGSPTAASTPTNEIIPQPSFYLPSYGLLNLTVSYKYDSHWTVRAFVDNALNKTYYAGSLNRNAVMPGIPINPHVSVTYSF